MEETKNDQKTIDVDQLAMYLNITPALAKSLHPVITQPITRDILEKFAKDFGLQLFMPKENCESCNAKFETEYITTGGHFYCLPCGHSVILNSNSFSVKKL